MKRLQKRILALFTAGFLVRAILAPFTGHCSAFPTTYNVAHYTVDEGVNIYEEPYKTAVGIFCYPPLWIYISSLMYLLWKATPFREGWLCDLGTNPTVYLYVNYPLILVLKLPIIFADLVIAWLLLQLVSQLKSEELGWAAAALWLFNPFVIIAGSVWGAFDAVAVAFSLLACYWVLRDRTTVSAILYGLSVAVKHNTSLLLPVLAVFVGLRRGWRESLRYVLVAGAVATSLCIPYLLWNLQAFVSAFSPESMPPFGEFCWGFSTLYLVKHLLWLLGLGMGALGGGAEAIRYATLASLIAAAAYACRSLRSSETAFFASCCIPFLVFYLISPVMNSNYLIWFMPFLIADVLVNRRSFGYMAAPVAIALVYVIFAETTLLYNLLAPIHCAYRNQIHQLYCTIGAWDYVHHTDVEEVRSFGLTAIAFSTYALLYIANTLRARSAESGLR